MLKMMEKKDNVKGEFDRPNSLVYQATLNTVSVTYAQGKPLSCSPDIFQFHLDQLQSYW